MIVNLYVDHMMSQPATSSDDVWAATRDHSRQFTEAAKRIGLTPAEYREFRSTLLDGNAMYVRLPSRLDAMSAKTPSGRIYVVKNAVMWKPVMGWKVALADGNVVYVPAICGNISLQRPVSVAHAAPKRKVVAAVKPKFHPALGVVAAAPVAAPAAAPVADTPVVFTPPVVVPEAAPVVAAAPLAVPVAAAHGASPFFLAIPAVLGAIVAGATHHDSPTLPPCSQGSNLLNACQK